tara:strand:+ start:60 stop:536 length:477 start_codon:yes stop_codon:yes gene_type:complete
MNTNYKINTEWNVWIHSIFDDNWNIHSYKNIFNIANLYDYKYFISNMKDIYLSRNMVFIMRGGIEPIWEDDNNRNGCTFSFKIDNKHRLKEFDILLKKVISESIHRELENYNNITGISIVPKRAFTIIKIWVRNKNTLEIINTYKPYIIDSNLHIKHH